MTSELCPERPPRPEQHAHSPPEEPAWLQQPTADDQVSAPQISASSEREETSKALSVEKLQETSLFEHSPEQWFRNRHPDWSDQEIASALVLIKGGRLIELYEELKNELDQDQDREQL